MPTIALALLAGLQAPAAAAIVPNCANPPDAATAAYCRGDDLVRHAADGDADDDQREDAWKRGAESFRHAADLAADPRIKKLALEKLEDVYDEKHRDRPRDAEPVLRELIALSPGDLVPIFRLARVQERQEQFDAAESTLLAAHQLHPDEIEPNRQLAQFFARRAAALSADKERDARAGRPRDTDEPDKDGIYRLGNGSSRPSRSRNCRCPSRPRSRRLA